MFAWGKEFNAIKASCLIHLNCRVFFYFCLLNVLQSIRYEIFTFVFLKIIIWYLLNSRHAIHEYIIIYILLYFVFCFFVMYSHDITGFVLSSFFFKFYLSDIKTLYFKLLSVLFSFIVFCNVNGIQSNLYTSDKYSLFILAWITYFFADYWVRMYRFLSISNWIYAHVLYS